MRWDTTQIKNMVDCRDVVERDLGAPKIRNNKYNVYRCPLHGETKGYSLAVYEDHWICYGKCNKSGDAIQWLQEYGKYTFPEACQMLGGRLDQTIAPRPVAASHKAHQPQSEAPSDEWQEYARRVVDYAEELLWSPAGEKALHYLIKTRGLMRVTIRDARLGYIPAETETDYQYGRVPFPEWKLDGKPVRVHCGIQIPHFADGQLWAVRTRRPPGLDGPKYMGIRGGSKTLYRIDEVLPRLPVVITEGEFDALVLDQCAGYMGKMVQSIALCSASNKHIDSRWLDRLVSAPVILARLDDDPAGAKAFDVLHQLSSRVRCVQVPTPFKDVNEFYLASSAADVRAWIEGCAECK